jgi:hypothetical protein
MTRRNEGRTRKWAELSQGTNNVTLVPGRTYVDAAVGQWEN